jgi:hypothetical protein
VVRARAKVHLRPVLKGGRGHLGRRFEAGQLSAQCPLGVAFDLLGLSLGDLTGRARVAAALKPEVVLPDVAAPVERHESPPRPVRSSGLTGLSES